MEYVRLLHHHFRTLTRAGWMEAIAYTASAIFFVANFAYVAYPDEFVNILGGVSILHGGIPYTHFFDHHLPGAWYLAALFLLLSFKSFVWFRFWWCLSLIIGFFWLSRWIKKHYHEFYTSYLWFIMLYPLAAVYFWFHLYLADSLAVFFFALIFWMLMVQTLTKRVDYRAILWASVLTWCLIFSSLTFLYLAGFLYIWQIYLIGKDWPRLQRWAIWVVAPYLLFLIWLVLSGSFADFYISNFVYNTKLYISIPNYTRGAHFNPLKFMMTIIYNFAGNYLALLSKIKHLDLYLPIGTLAGLGTLTLLVLLLIYHPPVGVIYFFILMLSAPRSNVQEYKETDYQSAMFLVLGMVSALVAIYLLRRLKTEDQLWQDLKRVVQFIMVVFLFFTFIFLAGNAYSKFFQRYTQQIPSIANKSFTAEFIDGLLDQGDYYWIGPYEPQEEFYVRKGKTPGKFPTLLPQFREDDYFKQGFLAQFDNHPPKIIIFEHQASIFGTPAIEFGKFFLDWMKDKYTSIENIHGIAVLQSPSSFTLKSDLYILNAEQDKVLARLRATGYIR